MRTNSRGSVVSSSDLVLADSVELPPTVNEEPLPASAIAGALATPPEMFDALSGMVSEMDLNETPRPCRITDPMDDEPTPRAPSVASTQKD